MAVEHSPRASTPVWLRLYATVDIDLLVYFRIVFGSVMTYWVVKASRDGLVEASYIAPRFHFHYFGFGWVEPLPEAWMHRHFYLLGICAALVALGCLYRLASTVFAIGFIYVFLIDKCLYQNHYYLVCLIAALMPWLPAHRSCSLDALFRRSVRAVAVPAWTVGLLRFHIGLPYFFGGLAKLSPDWLAGEPMRTMLSERVAYPILGQFFREEWCVQAFVWGGLLFDLLVVPALLWSRTRWLAFLTAVCFHLLNATLFTIGIFPWLMILATVVYFPTGSLRRLVTRGRSAPQALESTVPSSPARQVMILLLATYVAIQLMMPLRHYLQPGNPNWTEEGHYFAWHMLLRGKKSGLRVLATDMQTQQTGAIDLRRYVTPRQLPRVSRDPRMIHELVRIIAADLRRMGFENVKLRVKSLVSMNGRKPQYMIEPTVNLAAEPITWAQPRWIVPLQEPLRDEPWDVPLAEWERHVTLPTP